MSMETDSMDSDCSHAPTNTVVHHKVPCYTNIDKYSMCNEKQAGRQLSDNCHM